MLPIALFAPQGIGQPQQAFLITALMILINQPHFAHSYQIFYANFATKAFGHDYPRELRWCYVFAGIIAPLLLILFLALSVWRAGNDGDTRVLSYGANLMFFLVGWHYAKQGYGILIVDSIQKGVPFSARAKSVLRFNAYACWMVAWIGVNHALPKALAYLGITYYTLPIPQAVYYTAITVAVGSTLATLALLVLQWRDARAAVERRDRLCHRDLSLGGLCPDQSGIPPDRAHLPLAAISRGGMALSAQCERES